MAPTPTMTSTAPVMQVDALWRKRQRILHRSALIDSVLAAEKRGGEPLTMGDALAELLADITEGARTIGTLIESCGATTRSHDHNWRYALVRLIPDNPWVAGSERPAADMPPPERKSAATMRTVRRTGISVGWRLWLTARVSRRLTRRLAACCVIGNLSAKAAANSRVE
jgi:hypothetical protein